MRVLERQDRETEADTDTWRENILKNPEKVRETEVGKGGGDKRNEMREKDHGGLLEGDTSETQDTPRVTVATQKAISPSPTVCTYLR